MPTDKMTPAEQAARDTLIDFIADTSQNCVIEMQQCRMRNWSNHTLLEYTQELSDEILRAKMEAEQVI
jgi:hypothetical protein